eukprot:scaffold218190_cov23-Tisochrysis_lutea.AAC.1
MVQGTSCSASAASAAMGAIVVSIIIHAAYEYLQQQVKESYPLSGAAVLCKRRDLRRGKHTGRCRILEGGSVELDMQW